jgi:uncharacterized RDD family membrane protein YckC
MIFDLQKAPILKRASAWLLDFILLCILITGFAFALSAITGYDNYATALADAQRDYEQQYGVSFDIAQADFNALSQEEQDKINEAYAKFSEDEQVIYLYNVQLNLILLISSVSILLAYVLLEFVLPLIFGNGQTVGKKIFGIALMQTNGVKLSPLSLFARTVLGKYTLETMVPVFVLIMILFADLGLTGTIVLLLVLTLQIGLMIVTRTNSCIHDLLAGSVAVDLASQMIFDSESAMIEYKKSIHAEQAKEARY